MPSEAEPDNWKITCKCKSTVLEARGVPIHVAICHCADCRKAQGENVATETLALMRCDQVESPLDELKAVSAEEYNDNVPRYFCKSCNSCLLGDCSPIGFNMVIIPTSRISAKAIVGKPNNHMHLEEGIIDPANDGLPGYSGNPEDPHMAQLIEACS